MAVRFRKTDRDTWYTLTNEETESLESFMEKVDKAKEDGKVGYSVELKGSNLSVWQGIANKTRLIVADGKYPNDPNPRPTEEVVFIRFDETRPKHAFFQRG